MFEKSSIVMAVFMADVAQLVRALVCGTRCRRFESDLPPHLKTVRLGGFLWVWKRVRTDVSVWWQGMR